MKYSFKDYLIDTLMFGLSVSITPIIYLSTFIIVNKFDYINTPVYLYLAIFISFLLPFIFGIFLSRKLCKQSISSYLTVFLIIRNFDMKYEIICIFHIKIPDSYFVFLLPQEEWIRGLFNKYNEIREITISIITPVLYTLLYFLGSAIKNKLKKA